MNTLQTRVQAMKKEVYNYYIGDTNCKRLRKDLKLSIEALNAEKYGTNAYLHLMEEVCSMKALIAIKKYGYSYEKFTDMKMKYIRTRPFRIEVDYIVDFETFANSIYDCIEFCESNGYEFKSFISHQKKIIEPFCLKWRVEYRERREAMAKAMNEA